MKEQTWFECVIRLTKMSVAFDIQYALDHQFLVLLCATLDIDSGLGTYPGSRELVLLQLHDDSCDSKVKVSERKGMFPTQACVTLLYCLEGYT